MLHSRSAVRPRQIPDVLSATRKLSRNGDLGNLPAIVLVSRQCHMHRGGMWSEWERLAPSTRATGWRRFEEGCLHLQTIHRGYKLIRPVSCKGTHIFSLCDSVLAISKFEES